jgi:hypothetical protein
VPDPLTPAPAVLLNGSKYQDRSSAAPQMLALHDDSNAAGVRRCNGSSRAVIAIPSRLRPILALRAMSLRAFCCSAYGALSSLTLDRDPQWASGSLSPTPGVVFLWLQPGEDWTWDFRKARTPGLSEGECKGAAKLVRPPQGRAYSSSVRRRMHMPVDLQTA